MKMQIPFAKPDLDAADAQQASDAILSGWVTQGPRVRDFETQFAAYVGAPYAVAVSNCTSALHLSLIVSGIGPGDEVICPSMSYIATANSTRYTGARVVFAEVDPYTYNLDPDDVRKRITARTKAVILVHQLGMPADIDAFAALCREQGLQLIEDAACAAGAVYKDKMIGSHSSLVCFSFHPRKVITTGDGGMITTNSEAYRDRLRRLRQHGMSVSDLDRHEAAGVVFEDHLELGYNYRMTDIQAALGISQLAKLDAIVTGRREAARQYREALHDIPGVTLPEEPAGCRTNYQSYSIRVQPACKLTRDALMLALAERGVATRRGVHTAHRQSAYADYCRGLSLPVSEAASDNSLLLPMYHPMPAAAIRYVADQVRSLLF